MSRGYTLFEVLLALAIIGLVLASVPLISGAGRPGPEARAAAHEVAAALRGARSEAIVRFQPVTFLLDVDERWYRVGAAAAPHNLPEELELSLYTANSELLDASRGAIRFFPDGSATGGKVALSGGGHDYQVTVDWLTGAIAVVE